MKYGYHPRIPNDEEIQRNENSKKELIEHGKLAMKEVKAISRGENNTK